MSWENDLAQAYRFQGSGEFKEALESFMALVPVDACRERAMLEAAKTYKMMNDPARAVDGFIGVLRDYPANAEAVKELGDTAAAAGLHRKACPVLEELARRGVSASFLALGKIACARRDFASALECLTAYRELAPHDPDAGVWLGKVHKEAGDLEKARDELRRVLDRFPESRDALFEMGDVRRRRGDLAAARGCYEKIVSFAGDDRPSYLRLAELAALTGDPDGARRAEEAVLRLTPQDPFSLDSALNELEVLQRKTVLQSKVKRLWVTVTSRCNIRCKTCGLWRGAWDLPYGAAREVMALYPYLERVVWLGGEVFLYRHFEEMFDEAARHANLKHQVITNGVILTERWIEKIVGTANAELTFSVDGTTREVYESIRQGASFEKLLGNIRATVAAKERSGSRIDLRLNAVIMRSNYRQIEEFVPFAKREGFNQISVMALHFDMAPEENVFYDSRDPEIARCVADAIPRLREQAARLAIDLDVLLPPGVERFEDAGAPPPGEQGAIVPAAVRQPRPIACAMPWKYMMICDKGDVYLTGSCVEKVGNLERQSVEEVWNSPMAQTYRQKMIEHSFDGICRTECISRW